MREVFLNQTIGMEQAGLSNKLLFGDINGDGRMEIVAVQGDSGFDQRYYPHQVTCVTAYDLDGKLLWQKGQPVEEPASFGADYPAQVYDIDGDGFCEILCVMEMKFLILDGRTGAVRKAFNLPHEHAHDCIIIANLTGKSFAQDIILKDRYHQMWAMDSDFNLLWTHKGNLGHYPWACDINLDGYDEVLAGYDMLNHKGEVIWSCKDLTDHADCIWMGYVDYNPLEGIRIVVGGSHTAMYDIHGRELWRYTGSIESQHIALGRFRDKKAVQIAGLDRIAREDMGGTAPGKDGLFLLDSNGRELWKENRTTRGWLTIADTINQFDDGGLDYILAYRRGGGVLPALYNGRMETVYQFPVDGYCYHADLTGCGTEDVLIVREQTAYIYAAEPKDMKQRSPYPVEQSKRLYQSTLYMGGELQLRALPNEKNFPFRKVQGRGGPTVYFAGDSTVCVQPAEPFYGWGQVMPEFFDDRVSFMNYAKSGRALKSFLWEGYFATLMQNMQKGDFLFVQFGHNDQKPENDSYAEAFTEYSTLLEFYIDKAQEKGALPILVTSMERRNFDAEGNVMDSHGDYPEAVRQVARKCNVPLIDLHTASKKLYKQYGAEGSVQLFVHEEPGVLEDFPDGIQDNTHFRYRGAKAIAGLVCDALPEQVPELAAYLRNK